MNCTATQFEKWQSDYESVRRDLLHWLFDYDQPFVWLQKPQLPDFDSTTPEIWWLKTLWVEGLLEWLAPLGLLQCRSRVYLHNVLAKPHSIEVVASWSGASMANDVIPAMKAASLWPATWDRELVGLQYA